MTTTTPNSVRSFLIWVWSGVLILGGGVFFALSTGLLPDTIPLLPIVAGSVAAVGLPFMIRWLVKREGWALLAGWLFFGLGATLTVLYFTPGYEQLVVATLLIVLALPAIGMYAANHDQWWMLIPAYILIAAAALAALTIFHLQLIVLIGVAFLMVIVPLWLVGLSNNRARWVLIPAILITASALIVAVFFALLQPGTVVFYIALNGSLAVLGLTAWIVNRKLDVGLWLAGAFAAAAIVSIWFPSPAVWGITALVLGVYLQVRMMRGKNTSSVSSMPNQPAASPPPPVQPVALPPAAAIPPVTPTVKGPPPGVEFIPLDPFKGRKSDD